MSKEDLPIYLNDHLAGSVGALELVDILSRPIKEGRLRSSSKISATKSTWIKTRSGI
jgi:hypothetical protein